MGRKLGLTLEQVVEAAAEVADRDGLEALSLASVASTIGVRSPSLYNHVDGLAGIRRQLSIHASSLLTAELTDSVEGLESTQALRAMAEQLRSFARRHPGLYDSFLPAPTPQEDPEVAAALAQPTGVLRSVLAGMGVNPATVIPLMRAPACLGPRLRRSRTAGRLRSTRRHRRLVHHHHRSRDRVNRLPLDGPTHLVNPRHATTETRRPRLHTIGANPQDSNN